MSYEDFSKRMDGVEKLSKNSRKHYKEKLAKLCREFKQDPTYILTHPQETMEFINAMKDCQGELIGVNTKKALVLSVQALFKHLPDMTKRVPEKSKKLWKQYTMDIAEQGKKLQYNNELTENEKKGWVDWNDVLAKRDEYAESDYGGIKHLILSLYTYIPPLRNDFGMVKIYPTLKARLVENPNKNDGNFLILTDRSAMFYLNDYKTKHSYGQQKIELPTELRRVIKASLRKIPRDYLLWNWCDKTPHPSDASASNSVCRHFKEIFGKPMNTKLMRHSYLSTDEVRNMTTYERERLARRMLHSFVMSSAYEKRSDCCSSSDGEKTE